jgi:predicted transcriptional regulator
MQLAPKLILPNEISSQTVAILGIRGSGKTNTAGVIVEELLDKSQQVVVVDPTDAHWGYRLTAKGKHSKHNIFIFGGDHGDVPLREPDGKAIAEFLVEERVSVVLSLRHLRKAAQRRFVTELAEELYHLKGSPKYRTPMTVIIDEAPMFVPQTVTGEVAKTVGSIEDLVARGRNAGFGVVLISQRAATLNKNVLTQAETIICHRLTAPQDKKALKEWFEENSDLDAMNKVLDSLPKLPNGRAWIWSPRLDIFQEIQVRLRHTFDSSATPKVGDTVVAPVQLTEVDLTKLKGRMQAAIAEKQANDPVLLRRQLAEAQAKVLKLEAAPAKTEQVEKIVEKDRPLLTDKQLDHLLVQLDKQIERIETGTLKPLKELRTAVSAHRGASHESQLQQVRMPTQRTLPAPAKITSVKAAASRPLHASDMNLPRGEVAVLTAVLQFKNPERDEISILTGFKRSTRDTYIQRLREKGLLDSTPDGRIIPTREGELALPDFLPLPTGYALQDYWLKRLPEGEAAILHLLLQHPRGIEPEEISAKTNYARSTRDTYIQRMGAKRLCCREGGVVKPSASLF